MLLFYYPFFIVQKMIDWQTWKIDFVINKILFIFFSITCSLSLSHCHIVSMWSKMIKKNFSCFFTWPGTNKKKIHLKFVSFEFNLQYVSIRLTLMFIRCIFLQSTVWLDLTWTEIRGSDDNNVHINEKKFIQKKLLAYSWVECFPCWL